MQQIEEFKIIKDYENYSISNLGNVKNNKTGRILKSSDTGRGYLAVVLMKNKIRKSVLLHRLIAIAFIPNPNNKLIVDHADNDKHNNNVNNLRWCTHAENMQNRSISSDNTSGTTGVYFYKASNKWEAKIGLNGKLKHIGSYTTKEEAIQARITKANLLYGAFTHHSQKIRNELDELEAEFQALLGNN
jgi:hypothetical protein